MEEEIEKIMNNKLKHLAIEEKTFARMKKSSIASLILDFEDVEIVNSLLQNDILNYETYIEIDNYDELIKAVESINEFFEYSRQKLFAAWNVYIKYGKIIVDPYTSSSDTKEDAIKNAQDQFKIKSKIIQE